MASRTGAGRVRVAALATEHGDRDRRQHGRHAGKDEDEADTAETVGADRPDRRAEQQPAHLGRPVEPERLTVTLRWRRVRQVPAGRRIVDRGGQPDRRPQDEEGERPGDRQRQDREHAGQQEPGHHQRDSGGPVGEPAEDGLADEPGGRPGGDHQPERGEIDALLGEIERQDRQEAAEAEPHDELGEQERRDAAPARTPGRVGGRERGPSHPPRVAPASGGPDGDARGRTDRHEPLTRPRRYGRGLLAGRSEVVLTLAARRPASGRRIDPAQEAARDPAQTACLDQARGLRE